MNLALSDVAQNHKTQGASSRVVKADKMGNPKEEDEMAKKGKFDLSNLVNSGIVRNGETLYFVSDPSKSGSVARQANGEYKLALDGDSVSVHAAAQKFLGQEPPNHASQWLRNGEGKTLYQLWQSQNEDFQ